MGVKLSKLVYGEKNSKIRDIGLEICDSHFMEIICGVNNTSVEE